VKLLKTLLWIALAITGAFSYAVIIRLIRPQETVNALWLVIAAACTYILAYRFYGKFLATKVFVLDDRNLTPAVRMADGRDYHPTNKWVLFGHHFAAIAGAGPLIGPILAAQFGYLPGALWILIGAVFAGAVHDFVILVASIRHDGQSLAEIAREEIGPIAGIAASFATIFIIIVSLAGLGLAVVNALNHSPWGTYTIACTIPIALFMGLYLYKIRYGKVAETTVMGVTLLIFAVLSGHWVVQSSIVGWFELSRNTLVVSIAVYGFIASVLPVWMLLCPRDYLSTYMKIGTILLLAIGIILMAPSLKMPPFTQFVDGYGIVIPGKLYPFLFITLACGAISGFHALVGTGTTPKMITRETDALPIGFGAMLVEGFVSIMAVVAAGILAPGDYFAINSMLSTDVLTEMGFAPERIQELSAMVGTNVQNRPGGAVSLAVGMASIFSSIPGMGHLMAYWYNFALMFEALFILTTVDTGTRVARFLVQEIGGSVYKPFKVHSWLPGTIVASGFVVFCWSWLIYTGNIGTIWPMFGVANQLLAAIALAIGTTIIIKKSKPRYALVTIIPMLFMIVTTVTASYRLIRRHIADASLHTETASARYLDTGLIALMALLAIFISVDAAGTWIRVLRQKKLL
jgi:carbon starvation protein